ncbi:hypothetical protein EON65_45610 [archaeon]|nr:MAG: hypothetical protein EON65_45610 [archaeon]
MVFLLCLFTVCSGESLSTYIRTEVDDCTPLSVWASCGTCLSHNMNNTWCSTNSFCFSNENATSATACRDNCGDDSKLITSSDDCKEVPINIAAIIFSFILLVFCPMCLISGCIYVVVLRCQGKNKVAVEPYQPLPVLHVLNVTTNSADTHADVPVLAHAAMVFPGDSTDSPSLVAGAVAQPVGPSPYSLYPSVARRQARDTTSTQSGQILTGAVLFSNYR